MLTNMSAEEQQELQCNLKLVVYMDTIMKLSMFQRALRLNGNTYMLPKNHNKPTTIALDNTKVYSTGQSETLLSEKVLSEIKLQKELDALLKIYTLAQNELLTEQENGEQNARLYAAIEDEKTHAEEVEKLQQQLQETQDAHCALKAQINQEKQANRKYLHDKDDLLALLHHNWRYVEQVNALEYDLVRRWEESRHTQNMIACQNEERELMQQILELQRRLQGEERLIREVNNFHAKQRGEFRTQIAHWQQKYDKDMEQRQAETQAREDRITELRKLLECRQQTYNQRVLYVQQYVEQKAAEQLIFEQQMYRIGCAVLIQSWWRGVMVRKGFGQFRKKAKKGKKGKGKGK